MNDIEMIGSVMKYLPELAEKRRLEKQEKTVEQNKADHRQEDREKIANEKLVFMSMPTKQLVEIVQQGHNKESPEPSRAQAYKRAEAMVDSKLNRLT